MAFDATSVGNLTDRINQDIDNLYFGTMEFNHTLGRDLSALTVFTNVKGNNQRLLTGSVGVNLKAADCSFADGATDDTFTEISIPLRDLEINKEWCIRDLEDSYLNGRLSAGQRYEGLEGWESDIVGETVKGIVNTNEGLVWTGTDAAGSARGIKTYVDANLASCLGGAAVGTTAITNANAYDQVKLMVRTAINGDEVLGEAIRMGGASLWCDPQIHYAYLEDYQATVGNAGNVNAENVNRGGVPMIDGTMCAFRPVSGLYGTGDMYLTFDGNFVVATDLLSDARDFRLYMDQDGKNVRGWTQYKLGAGAYDLGKVAAYVVA